MNEAVRRHEVFDEGLDKLIERFTKEEVSFFNKLSSSDIIFILKAIKQSYKV